MKKTCHQIALDLLKCMNLNINQDIRKDNMKMKTMKPILSNTSRSFVSQHFNSMIFTLTILCSTLFQSIIWLAFTITFQTQILLPQKHGKFKYKFEMTLK